jgi:pimeloyl-ACP methyl ester carboxylesterase
MINFHREGSGPPLVLLHGIGLSWQISQPMFDLLRDSFDVIACDSPGFGESSPLPEAVKPTIPAYADAFAAFFAELGVVRSASSSPGAARWHRSARSRRPASGRKANGASASSR